MNKNLVNVSNSVVLFSRTIEKLDESLNCYREVNFGAAGYSGSTTCSAENRTDNLWYFRCVRNNALK